MLRFQEIRCNIESENLQTQIEEMEKALKEKKQQQEIKVLFEKYKVRRGIGKDNRWKLDYQNKTIRKTHEIDMYRYILEHLEEKKVGCTINEVFYAWIEKKLKDGEIKNDTAERYEDDFIKYLKSSRFTDRDFREITEDDIVDFIDDLKPLKLTVTCFSNIKILLRGIFKYAKRMKLTELSITYVLKDIEVSKKCFKQIEQDESTQIYYDDEIEKILDFCHNAPLNERIKNCKMKRLAIAVTIGTGVRISELATLKFSDVDFEKGCIKLLRAQQREEDKINGGYRYFIGETKTKAGTRRIYVSDEVLRDIKELREMPHQTEYIFEQDGSWMKSFNFDREIRRICIALGIPVRSLHKLRKTYSTALLNSGVEKSLVRSQMGHQDIRTTLKSYYYDNLKENQKRQKVIDAVKF